MNETPTAAPSTPAPTAPTVTAPPVTPVVEPHSKSGLSPTEAATMTGWIREDVAKG